MKRTRDQIINNIIDADLVLHVSKKLVESQEDNFKKYIVDLDNYDIEIHKADTLKQFETVWKKEFLEKYYCYGQSVHFILPVHTIYHNIKRLLDNYDILKWKPKCEKVLIYGTKRILYSNKVSILLDCDILLDFSVERINFSPCISSMSILCLSTLSTDISNIANTLGLSVDTFLELISLFYHTFMFDPNNPSYVCDNFNQHNLKLDLFSFSRCKYTTHFTDRYDTSNTYQTIEQWRNKIINTPQAEFYKLYS